MMKLSLIRRFYETVDNGRSSILDTLSGRWFDEFDATMFRASANFVARVVHDGDTYYQRFNHWEERAIGHIEAELEYIRQLIDMGVNANRPIPSRNGITIETVDTPLGVFHAVMFEEVPGVHIESGDLDLGGFDTWGEALARVHKASVNIEITPLKDWSDHLCALKSISSGTSILHSEATKLESVLSEYRQDRHYGLIPFDFEMDNIKWSGDELGFVDFDDLCYHWHAADISYALRDLYGDNVKEFHRDDERFNAFIDGYRGVLDMPDEELDKIPVFIRLHNLYLYYRIHRALGEEPGHVEPEWAVNLRVRLRSKNEWYLKMIGESPLCC